MSNSSHNKRDENAMWTIFGYLLSGLLFWGGVGYAADKWLGTTYLTLAGLILEWAALSIWCGSGSVASSGPTHKAGPTRGKSHLLDFTGRGFSE